MKKTGEPPLWLSILLFIMVPAILGAGRDSLALWLRGLLFLAWLVALGWVLMGAFTRR